ncbi:MAG: ATP-binding protein [Myxococcales bacterium]|nr:ATP-binding protein [Myxococcales bacterium]
MPLNSLEQALFDPSRRAAEFDASSVHAWLSLLLDCALQAAADVRRVRLEPLDVATKPDGSPVTTVDVSVEVAIGERLKTLCPVATLVGEEGGGKLGDSPHAVAVDPIDGTWAFLNRTANCATSLAYLHEGVVRAAVVANPATGEVLYAADGVPARVLQLPFAHEEAVAYTLPLTSGESGAPLVRLHPSRTARPMIDRAMAAWMGGDAGLVHVTGGSPAWAICEAAYGYSTYVCLWGGAPALPYDLAAAVFILRRAGGEVVQIGGTPIDALRHVGPFVAGMSAVGRDLALSFVPTPRDQPAVSLSVPASVEAIAKVNAQLAQFASEFAIPARVLHRLYLVVDELVTNAVTHGGCDVTSEPIAIRCWRDQDHLWLRIEDSGPAFDPFARAVPDTSLGLEERNVGGLGIHLIQQLTDDARYERVDGRNQVTLTMRLNYEIPQPDGEAGPSPTAQTEDDNHAD